MNVTGFEPPREGLGTVTRTVRRVDHYAAVDLAPLIIPVVGSDHRAPGRLHT